MFDYRQREESRAGETRRFATGFEGGGRGQEQRDAGSAALATGKGKVTLPPRVLGGSAALLTP